MSANWEDDDYIVGVDNLTAQLDTTWDARIFTRDTAEDACYEIQKACWAFQTAIDRCETKGRIAFIAGMLDESRKRLGIICVAATAKELELNS